MFSLGMVKALIIHLWVKKKKNKKISVYLFRDLLL